VIFENRDENGGARIARIDAEISKTMILVVYDGRSRIQLADDAERWMDGNLG
jgi:hypothetical protein